MGACFFPRFLSSFHPTKSIFFTILVQHFPQSTFIFPCFHFCTLIAASAWSTCLAECFRLSMHIHSANRFGLHLTYLQFVRADDVFCMPIIQFSTMNRNVKRSSFQLKISFSHSELLLPFFLAISHIIFAHLYIRARNKCMHIIPMFGWLLWFFFLFRSFRLRMWKEHCSQAIAISGEHFQQKWKIQTSCWTVLSGLKHGNIRIFGQQTDLESQWVCCAKLNYQTR